MTTSRTGRVVVALAMLAALSGCSAWRAWRFARGDKHLTINANDVTFEGLHADGLRFGVALDFANQNEGEVVVRELELTASVGGRGLVEARHEESVTIAPHSAVTLNVPVVVSPVEALRAVADGDRSLVFAGGATVDFGALGEHRLTFESERKVLPDSGPKFRLDGVSMRRSSVRELHVTLTFVRVVDSEDPLRSASLTGTVRVNGLRAGRIACDQLNPEGDRFEVDVAVGTITAARIAARIARSKAASIKANTLFEGESGTLKFRVPYEFEAIDVSFTRDAVDGP